MNSFEEGKVLLINKPLRWTSFDVVRKIRNAVKIKKVGHAGTLDPLATGLLIVCTGKFTKKINEYMAREKEYTGTFSLGATTPTYDLESEPENIQSTAALSEAAIIAATRNFCGEILQVPPVHSAIKKNGKPVYLLARKGIDIALEPRRITIKDFTITAIDMPVIHFKVTCSTGTYIRSLAHDFGAALGCGAYLSSLCRTRIGEFGIGGAMTMEQVIGMIEQEKTGSVDRET
ncbi:MAG: tRNA pseudouridine(55) synthase TruB [Sphingobacteriales bacterium]|nr:tRNA pseudouridine(55) synthase TruB [Sphingobacteriales bacterium]OJY88375.1 MAG: tRNA pseudouridine(55) synthase TruB [Sphingobacteriales bacterium 44-15]